MFDYFSQKVEVAVEENPAPGKANLPKVKATMVAVDKMKTKNILTWTLSTGRTCCFQVCNSFTYSGRSATWRSIHYVNTWCPLALVWARGR